jgi:glutathione synthase/RimK-type ligase-like ATP-grasp enzyme
MAARIGLVTYAKEPTLTSDDRPLTDDFSALGVHAAPVRWDDPRVTWSGFDALVLRSCWDYHVRHAEFERWLAAIERSWNMHKSYLLDLQSQGIAIPATVWVNRGTRISLADVMDDAGWVDAIVKPAVSASATDTWRTGAGQGGEDAARFQDLVNRADVLVQRYVSEVATNGEWSVVLVDGAISHTVLKRPRGGDFRVQEEHGGSSVPAQAPVTVIEAAERIARLIPGEWLFARIDGVETAAGYVLMEVECIEPHLFFGFHPTARTRLAMAVASRLARRTAS